jgi:hypothetical protein
MKLKIGFITIVLVTMSYIENSYAGANGVDKGSGSCPNWTQGPCASAAGNGTLSTSGGSQYADGGACGQQPDSNDPTGFSGCGSYNKIGSSQND